MTCDGCSKDNAIKITMRFTKHGEKYSSCEKCSESGNSPMYYRDASGNRVIVSEAQKFSYATGTEIKDAKQLSEWCRKNNMVQTGTFYGKSA